MIGLPLECGSPAAAFAVENLPATQAYFNQFTSFVTLSPSGKDGAKDLNVPFKHSINTSTVNFRPRRTTLVAN